jgi:drug/metabolite transporter (DMT)-like permease
VSLFHIILSVLFAASIAVGQVLFKLAALAIVGASSGSFFSKAVLAPPVWIAFAWYGASSFLWLYILMKVPLSQAYPFALLGSAMVPIMSALVFHERLPPIYWLGSAIILVGLFIAVGRGAPVPVAAP